MNGLDSNPEPNSSSKPTSSLPSSPSTQNSSSPPSDGPSPSPLQLADPLPRPDPPNPPQPSVYSNPTSQQSHIMVTRSKTQSLKPKVRTDGTVLRPKPQCSAASTIPDEPTCFTEASKFQEWQSAMNEEFHALLQTQTWTLVPKHTSTNVLGVKWVFKTKWHVNGQIERRKARLVAKGFHQIQGLDYDETFSPIAKPSTIHLLLSLAIMHQWSVHQLDIHNAFLHRNLNEDVFIYQPLGFVNSSFPTHIYKLNKSLYGLKQAPGAWFSRLSDSLVTMGFSPSESDSSLFSYRQGGQSIFVLVYVDDLLVLSTDP